MLFKDFNARGSAAYISDTRSKLVQQMDNL